MVWLLQQKISSCELERKSICCSCSQGRVLSVHRGSQAAATRAVQTSAALTKRRGHSSCERGVYLDFLSSKLLLYSF